MGIIVNKVQNPNIFQTRTIAFNQAYTHNSDLLKNGEMVNMKLNQAKNLDLAS